MNTVAQKYLDDLIRQFLPPIFAAIAILYFCLSLIDFFYFELDTKYLTTTLAALTSLTFSILWVHTKYFNRHIVSPNAIIFLIMVILQLDGMAFLYVTGDKLNGFGVYLMIIFAGMLHTRIYGLLTTTIMLLSTWMGMLIIMNLEFEPTSDGFMLMTSSTFCLLFYYTRLKIVEKQTAAESHITLEQQANVFVSHSSKDIESVKRKITDFLDENDVPYFLAQQSINSAAEWEREILVALQECKWFIVALSPNSLESEWVKDELFWAIDNRPGKIVPIIINQIDQNEIHIRLRRLQILDFTNRVTTDQRKLLETIGCA